jgi:hypothetical protein
MTTNGEREWQVMGFLVQLTVPRDWDVERVERDLAASIGFGHPTIQIIYDNPCGRPETTIPFLPDVRPETTVSVKPDAGL